MFERLSLVKLVDEKASRFHPFQQGTGDAPHLIESIVNPQDERIA
jgi:hypothetical protein